MGGSSLGAEQCCGSEREARDWVTAYFHPSGWNWGYLGSWGLYLPLLLLILLVCPWIDYQHLQPSAGKERTKGEVCAKRQHTGTAAMLTLPRGV